MKKILPLLVLSTLLLVPVLVLGQEAPPKSIPVGPQTGAELLNLINGVANWIFSVLLVLAAIMLVWGGFEFVTSGGSPEGVTAARNKIIYGLIGVAVALLSRGLVSVLRSILGL